MRNYSYCINFKTYSIIFKYKKQSKNKKINTQRSKQSSLIKLQTNLSHCSVAKSIVLSRHCLLDVPMIYPYK